MEYISVAEAAKRSGMSKRKILRRIQAGLLQGYKRPGETAYHVDAAEVAKLTEFRPVRSGNGLSPA